MFMIKCKIRWTINRFLLVVAGTYRILRDPNELRTLLTPTRDLDVRFIKLDDEFVRGKVYVHLLVINGWVPVGTVKVVKDKDSFYPRIALKPFLGSAGIITNNSSTFITLLTITHSPYILRRLESKKADILDVLTNKLFDALKVTNEDLRKYDSPLQVADGARTVANALSHHSS